MVNQERGVSAQTSHSSEGHGASGKRAALFPPKRNEQRNQTWSSARSDLARREIHMWSLNKCIGDLQKRTEAQSRALPCRPKPILI